MLVVSLLLRKKAKKFTEKINVPKGKILLKNFIQPKTYLEVQLSRSRRHYLSQMHPAERCWKSWLVFASKNTCLYMYIIRNIYCIINKYVQFHICYFSALLLTPVLSHRRKVWKDPTANNSPSTAQATDVIGYSWGCELYRRRP